MLRFKDKECYNINIVALPSLSENVLGLCNQLNHLHKECFDYTEEHGFASFYNVVHTCNAIIVFEGSELDKLFSNFVVNFDKVFLDYPNFAQFSCIFPKTYQALLEYNKIVKDIPLKDKLNKSDNYIEYKRLLECGLVENSFDLFQHLVLKLCTKLFIQPSYQAYGKDGHVYSLMASPYKGFNKDFTKVKVLARSITEAKLKFALMYLLTEFTDKLGNVNLPKDEYGSRLVKRYKEVKKGITNARSK